MEDDTEDPFALPQPTCLQPVKVRLGPPEPPDDSSQGTPLHRWEGNVALLTFMSNGNALAAQGYHMELGSDSDIEFENMDEIDSMVSEQMQTGGQGREPSQNTARQAVNPLNAAVSAAKSSVDPRSDSPGVAESPNINCGGAPVRAPSKSSADRSSINSTDSQKSPLWQAYGPGDSLVTPPLSAHLKDPDSPGQKLPALQHRSPKDAGSPQTTKLPSVVGLFEIADQVNETANTLRQRQSPLFVSPPLQFPASSARSPVAFPPGSHTSPTLTQSDSTSPRDYRFPLSGTGVSSPYFLPPRRTSAAPETSPSAFHPAVASASASSTDGTSPSTQPTPLSTDGRVHTTIVLPRPVPSIARTRNLVSGPSASSPASSPAVPGAGYKCDFSGCGAQPFQTQSLLNSHALVHSQSRPHYCPVPGCPRGAGGKGFKRKNEMIRHGLVHDSPGYVCPFCPGDREHRYPRPDNLLRHVGVHHSGVDRGDVRLTKVLALRLAGEGRGRGRRRRVK